MAKVFVDPGHAEHDPGALGKLSKEKDNVLKVGLRLKTLLESAGHTVKMSRTTDVFIGLSERARMANNWRADYFISLHNNSAADSSASGFETFIFNGTVSAATSKLQVAIHKAIASKIGIRDRGQKRANLAVLRESAMPAVLIEYAFISHAEDEAILINKVEQLAQWTAEGITDFAGGSVKPATKPTTKPTNKEEFLMLNSRENEELAKVYALAREKGVFSSDQHEKDARAGKMMTDRAVYLATVIAGAALNDGKRIE